MRYRNFIFIVTASLLSGLAVAAQPDMVCEYGQPMSIAGDHKKDNVINMIWQGYIYRMNRVPTSTGVHRFENAQSGLIWIGIPSKTMLLDRMQGTPVVSECVLAGGPKR